jgi:hypothetical protein
VEVFRSFRNHSRHTSPRRSPAEYNWAGGR